MKKFKPYVRYSEHPYIEATIRGTKVNVVPCYDVKKGQWQSAADRSPFHTKFMLESLTGPMKDEVRLLKNFLSSNKIYGSEIAKQGISGYVTEVLILHYGSFQDVIKAIAKLKKNQIIGKPTKSFDTSIIIIDPIDSNRNLGAAISNENVGKFIIASRAFQKKPSISFFKSLPRPKIFKKNSKNNMMWIGSNRKILSLQKRRQNDVSLFLNDLLKNHLNKSGIPKGLKADIKKRFKI